MLSYSLLNQNLKFEKGIRCTEVSVDRRTLSHLRRPKRIDKRDFVDEQPFVSIRFLCSIIRSFKTGAQSNTHSTHSAVLLARWNPQSFKMRRFAAREKARGLMCDHAKLLYPKLRSICPLAFASH